MRIGLIYPRLADSIDKFCEDSLLMTVLRRLLRLGRTNYTPPMSLLMLGAVTPPDIEVRMIDERLEEIDYDDEFDLVGITVTTRAAPRAYEIASEYRNRGVPVVLGGVHPSVLPEESVRYADTIVVGEGESVWPQILTDYRSGDLKKIYTGELQYDLDELPFPRREIIQNPERYITTKVITTSRGCPNSCIFCSAGSAVGKPYRVRSIENVLAELNEVPGRLVLFADDNLGWDIEHAKMLLRAIIPLNIMWIGGLSLSAFEDLEFTDLVAESGCITLDIGFESLSPLAIAGMKKKKTNVPSRYRELIKRIHDRGIQIKGNFILGFDEDGKDDFGELIDFINETCIEIPGINTLIPFPGTRIFDQLDREERLLHKDWTHYDTSGGYVVYQPKQMAPRELIDGYLLVTGEIFSLRSIMHRFLGAKTVFSTSTLGAINYNLQQRSRDLRPSPSSIQLPEFSVKSREVAFNNMIDLLVDAPDR